MTYNVFGGTLSLTQSINQSIIACRNKSAPAVNVTLLLSLAAECRAVTSTAAPLVVYARRSAANPPQVGTVVA